MGVENDTERDFMQALSISVFIPTYNYGRFLPQAIESVLGQSRAPQEIIVADDGSTDGTAAVVARYQPRVQYRRFDHGGVFTLRNRLLGELRGDWCLNLDADDWIEPGFLEKAAALIQAREADPALSFVYADRVDFGAYSRFTAVPEFSAELLKQKNYIAMDSLIKRSVALQFGFDPAFNDGWGDYDFFVTLVKNGYTGVRLAGCPVHCRVHPGSITAATFRADKKQQLMRRIVAKHGDFFAPSEARAAIDYFAPAAVRRHHLLEIIQSRRYGVALGYALRLLLTHPGTLFCRRVFLYLSGKVDS